MDRLIDMHCHILPGVDDGSPDIETTRLMLQHASSEGITTMVATPHYQNGRFHATPEQLYDLWHIVEREAAQIDPNMKIYLGCEVFNSSDIGEYLESGRALTMNGGSYAMVEFMPTVRYDEIVQCMSRMRQYGFRPIIAHVERYAAILKEPVLVEELSDMGALIQVNSGSITGKNGFSVKSFCKKLLKYELIDLLGTDAHSAGSRRPDMRKCIEYVRKKCGEEYTRLLAYENAEAVLRNQSIRR